MLGNLTIGGFTDQNLPRLSVGFEPGSQINLVPDHCVFHLVRGADGPSNRLAGTDADTDGDRVLAFRNSSGAELRNTRLHGKRRFDRAKTMVGVSRGRAE